MADMEHARLAQGDRLAEIEYEKGLWAMASMLQIPGLALACAASLAAVKGSNRVEAERSIPCTNLDLAIREVGRPPTQYVEFCQTRPEECAMSGEAKIDWTREVREKVSNANTYVNKNCILMPDLEWQGEEDVWGLPFHGRGDCEDFALGKRRRLSQGGIPRAALRLAIGIHATQYISHVVLLIDTNEGTYTLDNESTELKCWSATEYYFEGRERLDGLWDWYDQAYWKLGHSPRR
ncbi:MAG: transglutaminase-like cysteine peptidase [Hyphomicrobiaceae bacterium]